MPQLDKLILTAIIAQIKRALPLCLLTLIIFIQPAIVHAEEPVVQTDATEADATSEQSGDEKEQAPKKEGDAEEEEEEEPECD